MTTTLTDIAQKILNKQDQKQLIYAFNGIGKTRLSLALKELVYPTENNDNSEDDEKIKVIYYNAFTEDLFYWDNDNLTLNIRDNKFTQWILEEQGLDMEIISHFQHYNNTRIMPQFHENFTKVNFLSENEIIKISKGEESNFIWSVFYALLEQIIAERNIHEESERSTDKFNDLEYIFIDDPVSSLDENHLIELAVNLASLIKLNQSDIKFVITTHNTLFYNVIYNELDIKKGYILQRNEDNSFELNEKKGDSNICFSYHIYLKQIIEKAINENSVSKYHFMLLRNLYEKTALFLGYQKWGELLPEDSREQYHKRIMTFCSHSTLSNETVAEPTEPEKNTLKLLLTHLISEYKFNQ